MKKSYKIAIVITTLVILFEWVFIYNKPIEYDEVTQQQIPRHGMLWKTFNTIDIYSIIIVEKGIVLIAKALDDRTAIEKVMLRKNSSTRLLKVYYNYIGKNNSFWILYFTIIFLLVGFITTRSFFLRKR